MVRRPLNRVISWNFHPFIHVVWQIRVVLLELKAHMMYHRRVAWQNLYGGHPGILFERRRKQYAFPFHHPSCGNRIRREIYRNIWLDTPTAFRPLNGWRGILWISCPRAVIRPSKERVNLHLAQGAIVVKMPVLGIGQPLRHSCGADRVLDGLRPRTSALIIEE